MPKIVSKKLINIIQTRFKVSKFELIAISIFFSGLVIATIISYVVQKDRFNDNKKFSYSLSNLALEQQNTCTGSELENNIENQESNNATQPIMALLDNPDSRKNNDSLFQSSRKEKLLPSEKININTASKSELMKLPGIGEKMASEILNQRAKKKFNKIEDIMNVRGIGEKKFQSMKTNIKVTN